MRSPVNHYFLLCILCCISFAANAQSPRKRISLDDDWKFAFGHASQPEKDFNYSIATIFSKSGGAAGTAIDPAFNDQFWRKLDLPHDWAVELPFVNVDNFDVQSHGYKPVGGLFPATSIGWYRKQFPIDAKDSGQRFQIQFDGIFRNAKIWVNGFYLGTNESGYLGNHYDITDFIHFKKPNTVVVRVDATQYEGWFYEGAGIYRHVWLNQYQNAFIEEDGIFAYSKINGNKAKLTVTTELKNAGMSPGNYSLQFNLLGRDGKKIGSSTARQVVLQAGIPVVVEQAVDLPNIIKWTLDQPYLYKIAVELKDKAGKLVDQRMIRFGFRTIEVKPDGVFLNGEYVKLYGTNNHQDHAGVGSALPDYLQYYRIQLLKKMGSNAYRCSHHAPTPELLDACDSLGMLVMDEQRLLNSGDAYMDQFERLVKRDRNHPSVFMWSIGNEEGWIHTNSFGKRIAQSFIQKLKILDPTRTSTYAADVANVFNGVNQVIPVRSFNYRQFAVDDYHRDHPQQPIIGTEMGSTVTTRGVVDLDSVRAYLPDQDITAPWWASTAETWWKLAADKKHWLGGFIWTGLDYRGEPTPFKWPNINSHFGVMDVCGFPKNIYYYYKSWWTNQDILHISPHWNHPQEWGKPNRMVDVWVNSNADDVELFLNGKSLGKKTMPVNGHLQWAVTYAPGKLEAVAYKKGKRLYQKIETTGTAVEVVVTPYKTTILADGRDATVINITAVDREGREVPNADNMIHFSLEGAGKIIGVGNGDPSSHEPDKCPEGNWKRSLFNGKCQVIIQSTNTAGTIKFDASSSGMWKGGTDIITVSPSKIEQVNIDPVYKLTGEAAKPRAVDKMLGADISFLPELEAKGTKFSDKGVEKDAIAILKDHGFNYIRLRIFNDPARDSGYSPKKGFCDLNNTLLMAKRVKAAGMKLLLDFHYSDYWADPGKQFKPAAWRGLSFNETKKALYDYTRNVMQALKDQQTLPDMVQVGNEINHGIVWPDGNVQEIDQLAQLLNAGTAAVKSVNPATIMMLHVALGGQNDETVFFVDNMLQRGVPFDVIGESYYPKWHGTLEDLDYNLRDLIRRYNKDLIVVEYSALKEEVNKIVFELPGGKGKGTCIWEPLSTWDKIFDDNGKSNEKILIYDNISKQFILP
jgi:beta-galactosidase